MKEQRNKHKVVLPMESKKDDRDRTTTFSFPTHYIHHMPKTTLTVRREIDFITILITSVDTFPFLLLYSKTVSKSFASLKTRLYGYTIAYDMY
jgi:hypothetical protein